MTPGTTTNSISGGFMQFWHDSIRLNAIGLTTTGEDVNMNIGGRLSAPWKWPIDFTEQKKPDGLCSGILAVSQWDQSCDSQSDSFTTVDVRHGNEKLGHPGNDMITHIWPTWRLCLAGGYRYYTWTLAPMFIFSVSVIYWSVFQASCCGKAALNMSQAAVSMEFGGVCIRTRGDRSVLSCTESMSAWHQCFQT